MTRHLTSTALSLMLLGGVALAQTDAAGSGSATGSGGVSVDGSGVDASGNLGATGGATVNSNDTSITGSTGANASASASADTDFFENLGDSADDFFSGENNEQVRPEDEITQAFEELDEEEQARLRQDCDDVDLQSGHSKQVQDFCGIIADL